MRVGIDLAPLRPPYTGVSNYVLFLYDALLEQNAVEALVGFDNLRWHTVDRAWLRARATSAGKLLDDTDAPPDDAAYEERAAPGLSARLRVKVLPLLYRVGSLHAVRTKVRGLALHAGIGRTPIDVFHAGAHRPPADPGVPIVPVLHDLSHMHYPEAHPKERLKWLAGMPAILERAPVIQTVSNFSRDEMIKYFGTPQEKIGVVYPSVAPLFFRAPPDLGASLQRLGLEDGGYALAVSTIEPRKNLRTLVAAFSRLAPAERRRLPLVIAGARGWGDVRLGGIVHALVREGTLRFLGFVPDPLLRDLMAGTRRLFLSSLYEGFGMPAAEALATGSPVTVSNVASLPEVVGAVGEQVAPEDVDAWTEALRRALSSTVHTDVQIRARNRAQAMQFTPDEAARRTAVLLHRAVGA